MCHQIFCTKYMTLLTYALAENKLNVIHEWNSGQSIMNKMETQMWLISFNVCVLQSSTSCALSGIWMNARMWSDSIWIQLLFTSCGVWFFHFRRTQPSIYSVWKHTRWHMKSLRCEWQYRFWHLHLLLYQQTRLDVVCTACRKLQTRI